MTEPSPLPPALEVVPGDVARALIDEVRAAIGALERELVEARRQVDECEAGALPAPAEAAVGADLRRLADGLRADAEAYAAQVLGDARARAAAAVGAAARQPLAAVPLPAPAPGEVGAPRLRLAPPVDPAEQ